MNYEVGKSGYWFSKEQLDEHDNKIKANHIREVEKKVRAEVIEEIMKKAKTIQLEQIDDLNKSQRRNAKMWARYMITYLGHIQTACIRMLESEVQK